VVSGNGFGRLSVTFCQFIVLVMNLCIVAFHVSWNRQISVTAVLVSSVGEVQVELQTTVDNHVNPETSDQEDRAGELNHSWR
jgi:hypothetical protein